MAKHAKQSPVSEKKSFPKNGYPGLFPSAYRKEKGKKIRGKRIQKGKGKGKRKEPFFVFRRYFPVLFPFPLSPFPLSDTYNNSKIVVDPDDIVQVFGVFVKVGSIRYISIPVRH